MDLDALRPSPISRTGWLRPFAFSHPEVVILQAEKQLGCEWSLMRSAQPNAPNLEDSLAKALPFSHPEVSLLQPFAFSHPGIVSVQAEKQLGCEWTLMRSAQPNVLNLEDWLAETLPPKSKVGIDPFLHSAENARSLGETLRAKDVYLTPLYESNLVDQIWEGDRPAPPKASLRVHPLKYAGKEVGAKVRVWGLGFWVWLWGGPSDAPKGLLRGAFVDVSWEACGLYGEGLRRVGWSSGF
jgi:hypothetical protein